MMETQPQTTRQYKELWMIEDRPATEYRQAKSFWTKIGVAWANRDGSWALHLSAFPVNGKVHMRDPSPREDRGDRNGSGGDRGERGGDHGAAA